MGFAAFFVLGAARLRVLTLAGFFGLLT